jgi:hypothetical protein
MITSICRNSSSILLQQENNAKLSSALVVKAKLIADLSDEKAELSHQNSELSRRIVQLKLTTKEAIDNTKRRFLESSYTRFPVADLSPVTTNLSAIMRLYEFYLKHHLPW